MVKSGTLNKPIPTAGKNMSPLATEMSNLKADKKTENRFNPKVSAEEIETGDQILLFRPASAIAKRQKLNWIGPYEVVASNNQVVKISDNEGKTDWVHRSHVCKKPKRPPSFGPPPPFIPMAPPLRNAKPVPPEPPRRIVDPIEEPMVPDPIEDSNESDIDTADVTIYESCEEETGPHIDKDPATDDASQALIERLMETEPPRRSKRLNPEPTTRSSSRQRTQVKVFQA